MNYFKFIFLFIPLCGCGENLNFSVGATKGGSGTGSMPSQSSGEVLTPPVLSPLPSEGDEDEVTIYYMKSNGSKEKSCGNALITIQPLDKETLSQVPKDQNIIIPPSNEAQPSNLYFQIKVKNTGNSEIYEYYNNCEPNIELYNEYNVIFEGTQKMECLNSEAILRIEPLETKVFNYKVTIPQNKHHWNMLYTPIFSFGNIKTNENQIYCQPIEYEINVVN